MKLILNQYTMKKIITICAACAALFAASSCGSKDNVTVTALVKGPHAEALVIDYGKAIDPATVTPEVYTVEGKEIVCANVVEDTKVIVVLKHECNKCDKPECCKEGAECCKEGAECCEEAKPECCEEKKAECCEEAKPECCELPVPEIAVQQVADIKTVDGKTVAAWKAAVKATAAQPACPKPCCEEAKPECCKEAKAE